MAETVSLLSGKAFLSYLQREQKAIPRKRSQRLRAPLLFQCHGQGDSVSLFLSEIWQVVMSMVSPRPFLLQVTSSSDKGDQKRAFTEETLNLSFRDKTQAQRLQTADATERLRDTFSSAAAKGDIWVVCLFPSLFISAGYCDLSPGFMRHLGIDIDPGMPIPRCRSHDRVDARSTRMSIDPVWDRHDPLPA